MQMERTLARMVCGLLGLWSVSWTPYALTSMWIMFLGARGLSQVGPCGGASRTVVYPARTVLPSNE